MLGAMARDIVGSIHEVAPITVTIVAIADERRARRPLRIVAVRHGCPEHRHHAVADVLVDGAAETLDQAIGELEEAIGHGVHGFGAELMGQAGVASQVAEQYGHLPPLALDLGSSRHRRRRLGPFGRAGPKLGDRLQKLPAVAQGDAEPLQVGVAQLGQDLGVDVVGPERRLVAFQAKTAQPTARSRVDIASSSERPGYCVAGACRAAMATSSRSARTSGGCAPLIACFRSTMNTGTPRMPPRSACW
jgi:hypothetical protein